MKLEKLIQISVLIAVQVRPIQMWEVCDKSKILVRLWTFWTTPHYVCIYLILFIFPYVYMSEGRLKSSKPHPE